MVYIRHKFDHTKNLAIECFMDSKYKVWDYEDDLIFHCHSLYVLYIFLNQYNDGFLNVEKILQNLPLITKEDLVSHLVKIMMDYIEIDKINDVLNTDFKEKVYKDIYNYIMNNIHNIYVLRSHIHGFI